MGEGAGYKRVERAIPKKGEDAKRRDDAPNRASLMGRRQQKTADRQRRNRRLGKPGLIDKGVSLGGEDKDKPHRTREKAASRHSNGGSERAKAHHEAEEKEAVEKERGAPGTPQKENQKGRKQEQGGLRGRQGQEEPISREKEAGRRTGAKIPDRER
ncbi:PREDICTED: uncharacterized protein LOC109171712 [Ipomoea nil]|uniref:uncharacterized protein LOC109171712 n=1 Tax=Ipomoea nil TaxID=35883 RepID=UPI000900971D|nr:PREDICTED: uncharacterized protein LOC109171712 [Ipomoea nil]